MVQADNTTTSGGLAHYTRIHYDKKALTTRDSQFHFRRAASKKSMPKYAGRIAQLYRPQDFPVSTQTSKEGIPSGTGLRFKTKGVQLRFSQYTNHCSFSDVLMDTLPDPAIDVVVERMSYMLGHILNTVTRTLLDNVFSSVEYTLISAGDNTFRLGDARALRALSAGINLKGADDNDNLFWLFIHPYSGYDFVNDPDATGYLDLWKYTMPNQKSLVRSDPNDTVAIISDARIIQTTNVLVTAGTPNKYRGYWIGQEAFATLELDGRRVSDVVDPSKQRFRMNIVRNPELSPFDPSGKIGGFVSYNVLFGTGILEGPASIGGSYRIWEFDAESALG